MTKPSSPQASRTNAATIARSQPRAYLAGSCNLGLTYCRSTCKLSTLFNYEYDSMSYLVLSAFLRCPPVSTRAVFGSPALTNNFTITLNSQHASAAYIFVISWSNHKSRGPTPGPCISENLIEKEFKERTIKHVVTMADSKYWYKHWKNRHDYRIEDKSLAINWPLIEELSVMLWTFVLKAEEWIKTHRQCKSCTVLLCNYQDVIKHCIKH